MSSTFMNKLYGIIGNNRESEEEYEDDDTISMNDYYDEEEEDDQNEKGFFGSRRSKVVSINQTQQIKMIISKPTSFEQTEDICECLKQKKSIIVNLEYVNKDVARRIVDFMSGAVQALDGHIEKVSNSIFLFAPMNYDITSEATKEEIRSKLNVSWLKNG